MGSDRNLISLATNVNFGATKTGAGRHPSGRGDRVPAPAFPGGARRAPSPPRAGRKSIVLGSINRMGKHAENFSRCSVFQTIKRQRNSIENNEAGSRKSNGSGR